MNIILITDAGVFAGTEMHMLDLAVALREQGHDVEIACPGSGILAQRALAASIPVFAIEKRGRFDFRAMLRLRQRIKSADIDIVHAHNGRTALIATIAVLLAGRGCTILTQHFLDPARVSRAGWLGWLGRAIHRWILARAGHVVAISESVRNRMLERAEVPSAKTTTVWNGIADPTAVAQASPEEVRKAFGIACGVPLLVCAARLESEKAVDVLIEAMARVRQQFPDARCLVAGEGSLRQALQERIDALGLADAIILLGFRSDVRAMIGAADVFVLPSPSEPFGLVLLEAMALSRPVIAARAGGPAEVVLDGQTGCLVRPGCAEELAAAIISLVRDPALARSQGAEGRARFIEQFTAERMARQTVSIYGQALAVPGVAVEAVPVG